MARPLLVFGAGGGGRQTLDALLQNAASSWYPVALLDDDPALRNLSLRGVRVAGDRTQMAELATQHGATAVVIAIPSAPSELIRELSGLATEAGLQVLVLPPVEDLLGAAVITDDIRPLTERDLFGRHEVDGGPLTAHHVARHLAIGSAGSIGADLAELCDLHVEAALPQSDVPLTGSFTVDPASEPPPATAPVSTVAFRLPPRVRTVDSRFREVVLYGRTAFDAGRMSVARKPMWMGSSTSSPSTSPICTVTNGLPTGPNVSTTTPSTSSRPQGTITCSPLRNLRVMLSPTRAVCCRKDGARCAAST